MADSDFLHGSETIEAAGGPRPVSIAESATIGVVFTAPDADPAAWPPGEPVLVLGAGDVDERIGTQGTGRTVFDGLFDQAGRKGLGKIVAVRVEEEATALETIANVVGDQVSKTGLHALRRAPSLYGVTPKILIAPGFTSLRPANGVASIAVDEDGSGYTTAPAVTIAPPPAGGRQAKATAVLAGGAVSSIVVTDPGGGYNPAALPAVAIAAPPGGGTQATAAVTLGTVANPVVAEQLTLARRLRAVVVADTPGVTAEAAYQYRQDWDSDRLYIVDPMVSVLRAGAIASEPASARVAGLISSVTLEEGFWFSPSNHVIEGVVGLGRPIEHSISDPSVESQYLNGREIAVVVRGHAGGYKLFGNRVASSDPLKAFLSVRRSHDVVIETIERANEWAFDKPFSKQLLLDMAETVNGALRRFRAMGASLGGRVWYDTALNTAASMAAGQIYVHYDAEGPAPVERITYVFNRNTGYYDELIGDVAREIARLSAAV